MKPIYIVLGLALIVSCTQTSENESGLLNDVEVIRDKWGINHIYAQNEHDLFYAQGYQAAKDRLFQFEIWRRQATGTVAEILGERELKRDIGTRLFKFRGDMDEELQHYHPNGKAIIEAYVEGVNAYVRETLSNPDLLPVEFKLLDIKPGLWTPEVVISRHQGLLGNINEELRTTLAVGAIGPEEVQKLAWFHPQKPLLDIDSAIDQSLLSMDILELYNAYRRPVSFLPEDIDPAYRNTPQQALLSEAGFNEFDPASVSPADIGSNNWILRGNLTESGAPYMANDPHRTIAVPSLRYMAHLVAPGWNVIGGGEPEIPGISIGHNEYGAWGLTVFRTDGEDLYVYDLNPANLNQYWHKGSWVEMSRITEKIKVKDAEEYSADLFYTLHGPVTYIDSVNFKAYAVRCAWMEPGGAPYLASLRMDQAESWEEFRNACNYSNIPGENMIWADKAGNIGWQAVGIAPLRRNFSGMVAVPGDGRYEWDGYLPIIEKPNTFNPAEGHFSTANQNVTPGDYQHWDAIAFSWSDPYRGDRVKEVLNSQEKFTMEDMMKLQTDYTSLPSRTLIPMLKNLKFEDKEAIAATSYLSDWDGVLRPNSIAAGIYVRWEDHIKELAKDRFVPPAAQPYLGLQLARIIQWLEEPEKMFPEPHLENRDNFLREAFALALEDLKTNLGEDPDNWQYGQSAYKHSEIFHALGKVVNDSLQEVLNLPTMPRGGNSYTPGASGSNYRQTHGATFRIIVDTNDWDEAVGANSPGQSGNPDSPLYRNLYETWARDQFFPIYYTREKIIEHAISKDIMKAKN